MGGELLYCIVSFRCELVCFLRSFLRLMTGADDRRCELMLVRFVSFVAAPMWFQTRVARIATCWRGWENGWALVNRGVWVGLA